jgi:hypothetical protein
VIPAFVCPSAPRTTNPFAELTQGWNCNYHKCCFLMTRLYGASDYQGLSGYCNHVGGCCCINYLKMIGGTFRCGRGIMNTATGGVPIESITDGTSTTILFSEYAGRPAWWTKTAAGNGLVNHGLPTACMCPAPINKWVTSNPGGCWGCFNNAGIRPTGSAFSGIAVPASSSSSNSGSHQGFRGDTSGSGPSPAPSSSATVVPACFVNCTNEDGINIIFGFHPGAGGVAMCDGSAHMLGESIGNLVLLSMVTYRGQEAIPDSAVTQ